MILFVDCETSDLLKRNLPLSDPAQPWAVSIAAELTDDAGMTAGHLWTAIRADGRKIREGAEAVHGVSSAMAGRTGASEIAALGLLTDFSKQSNRCVGFGIDFDRRVIEGVLVRRGKDARHWVRPGLEFVDLMQVCTPICKLPPKEPREDGGFKWPSLDEACRIVLGKEPRTGLHNAWEDCQRAKELYFALLQDGAIGGVQ